MLTLPWSPGGSSEGFKNSDMTGFVIKVKI